MHRCVKWKKDITSHTDGTLPDSIHDTRGPCIVYKFQSRPPYEGFILILVILMFIVIFVWWIVKHS